MTWFEFVRSAEKRLSGLYSVEEGRTVAMRLLEDMAGVNRLIYAMKSGEQIPPELFDMLERALGEAVQGRPLQYITGCEWFCGLKFDVGEGVLIPRPETEELVVWVSSVYGEESDNLNILDAACGSGVIGISLASKLPGSTIYACDISEAALEYSGKNGGKILTDDTGIIRTGSHSRYNLYKSDLLNVKTAIGEYMTVSGGMQADIIVSNPPYVCKSERLLMRPNVLDYEPDSAIFVNGSDPLIFYRSILSISSAILKKGGRIFFEFNEKFGEEMFNLLQNNGFADVMIRRDFRGKDRMACGRKK